MSALGPELGSVLDRQRREMLCKAAGRRTLLLLDYRANIRLDATCAGHEGA